MSVRYGKKQINSLAFASSKYRDKSQFNRAFSSESYYLQGIIMPELAFLQDTNKQIKNCSWAGQAIFF
jgi:hypothetical protein